MKKIFKSNQQIIDEISTIVNPHMQFNIQDIHNTPYPNIDELTILHFKYYGIISNCKENELIKQVKSIGVGDVEINRYGGIGKFIVITLDKNYRRLIRLYNEYLDYKNKYTERINEIYEYLDEKIPEEFVGWVLFNENK